MKFQDVEDLNDKYLVSIHDNKNDYPGQFIIGNLFYSTVKKYILLRPTSNFSERFFIQYLEDKETCTRTPIERHTIGTMPKRIAYLQLPNVKRYTGQCFRRTSATLLSDSGANMQMIKQLGRWRSDMIAQGYVENSMHNRQMIYNGITQKIATDIEPKPSISKETTTVQENDGFEINWSEEDIAKYLCIHAKKNMEQTTRNLDKQATRLITREDFIAWEERVDEFIDSLDEQSRNPRLSIGACSRFSDTHACSDCRAFMRSDHSVVPRDSTSETFRQRRRSEWIGSSSRPRFRKAGDVPIEEWCAVLYAKRKSVLSPDLNPIEHVWDLMGRRGIDCLK
ncbi:PREDICTED: uncharacterized protein LOC105449152 [Wasmannia auropunctata]|uniref:uncharacterized protein LOC105449152 n=1 Tax=Wasmannia auropunctata TaxID=64793 RepID=UPI0005EE737E|nr:PREDICTED: uncharacterized protein LOC105449152 [Wasmannia auropunctata]